MTQSQFYGTKKWAKFAENIKLQRQNEEGFVVCDYCGKPILKRYDCIAHHKIELNDSNVNDASIALNPENIMLLHFGCHNKIHGKAEGMTAQKKNRGVYLVYGSPCAGKSTWVKENARPEDLIVDLDRIWEAVCLSDRNHKPDELKQNVFGIRDCLIEQIMQRKGKWKAAYIIGGYPLRSDRERLCELLNARPIFIEESKEVCLSRANEQWKEYVEQWFNDFVE